MKYVVEVDYKQFKFDDRVVAMDFAELAKTSTVKPANVEIVLKDEEEE